MNSNEILRFYREQHNLTRKEVAKMIGVAASTYYALENPNSNRFPKADIVDKLSSLYGIEPSSIIGEDHPLFGKHFYSSFCYNSNNSCMNVPTLSVDEQRILSLYSALDEDGQQITLEIIKTLHKYHLKSQDS